MEENKMVAMPLELYNTVRQFIGSQQYDVVKQLIVLLEQNVRAVEEYSGIPENKPSSLEAASKKTKMQPVKE